jgi:cytochrome P450
MQLPLRAQRGHEWPMASATSKPPPYTPPRPRSLSPLAGLIRTAWRGDGNLLGLLPASAYRMRIGQLGWSRRTTWIINDPEAARAVLVDSQDVYPKSDLMTGALEPLIGDSIFTSSGARWRQQRRMLDPSFSAVRVAAGYRFMTGAVDAFQPRLQTLAASGESVSLDALMSDLTADVICRAVFGTPLDGGASADAFAAFHVFERSVAQVELGRLIFDPPFKPVPQKPEVLDACAAIRRLLADLLDGRPAAGNGAGDDMASAILAARDPETGAVFTRDEVIDQLGVLFLAGHETSASALIWAVFILAQRPELRERLRAEVQAVAGDGAIAMEMARRLPFVRNIFRETLRLYPPITFLPRVAMCDTVVGGVKMRRGAMLMVSPWTMHRHHDHWDRPDVFDPDRFAPENEGAIKAGTYIPFGTGPRVCAGAAFATTEAVLILAELFRHWDFDVQGADRVEPAARLTTRPADQIMVRVKALEPGGGRSRAGG